MEPWGRQEAGERTDFEKDCKLLRVGGDQTLKGIWGREFKLIVCLKEQSDPS